MLLRFGQANKYIIMDPHGSRTKYLVEQDHGMSNMFSRQMHRTQRSFTANVLDKKGCQAKENCQHRWWRQETRVFSFRLCISAFGNGL